MMNVWKTRKHACHANNARARARACVCVCVCVCVFAYIQKVALTN